MADNGIAFCEPEEQLNEQIDPLHAFAQLFARAGVGAPFDHTVMALATSDTSGRVSVRMVLLHGLDARGLVFFTNYDSRKGHEIQANPRGAVCLYWPWLEQQVRVEGRLAAIDGAESDAYFATRPRGKQVGAWASQQSRPLASREELEERCRQIDAQYEGRAVPRPPFWGGFRLVPDAIEFWESGESRLHDRFLYTREADGWKMARLNP